MKNKCIAMLMLPIFLGLMFTFTACQTFQAEAKPMAFQDSPKWVLYEGAPGKPGSGKHVVLIAGDEEYRSEEAMPMLGRILSQHHGFHCAVLFSQSDDGYIDPFNQKNIPGLENLEKADLMMIFTRFRNLSDTQMQYIEDYLKSGKPVIGMRTSTHAFNKLGGKFAKYNNNYRGKENPEWQGGFGRFVLGEKWISHHGHHGRQSTRGIVGDAAHPIARGIKDGDIWGTSDVYGVRLPLPGDSKPVILGQVLKGMKFDDAPLEGKKNDPMMPVAWTKSYQIEGGEKGKVFNTTMGASKDLEAAGSRRMIVNGVYWILGLDVPQAGTKVDLVGDIKINNFGFNYGKELIKKKQKPSMYDL